MSMEDDNEEWTAEEYRGDHESDEHWDLRREFIVQNKGRFPKLRLLSLSQVFANMEFLGCRYPQETMDLVSELSVGIIEEYRKKRSGRLQRTFVKASDAAEKKSKGTKRQSTTGNSAPHENKVFIKESCPSASPSSSSSSSKPIVQIKSVSSYTASINVSVSDKDNGINSFNSFKSDGNCYSHLNPNPRQKIYEEALDQFGDDLKGLVLVNQIFLDNEGPLQILNRSCGMSHKPLTFDYGITHEGVTTCALKIGNSCLAEGKGFNKDSSRQEAATKAIELLRKLCYTIEVKAVVVAATEFSKIDINGASIQNHDQIGEDNVGNKLLKLMGWQGGGLGKDQQGISQPVSTTTPEIVKRSRLGLGNQDANFADAVKKFLTRQMWQCAQFDLQFSPEFNTDERKIIHQISGQLGLKSRSHGKGENRFLVVSRKIHLASLVQEILESGETAKYRVIEPEILSGIPSTATGRRIDDENES